MARDINYCRNRRKGDKVSEETKILITPKMLSAVLGREVKEPQQRVCVNDDNVTFAYADEDMWSDINIHELAHKCKEWAYNEGFVIVALKEDEEQYVVEIRCGWDITDFRDNTEPEAIFKACQYILDKEASC